MGNGGRRGDPKILAEFRGDRKIRVLFASQDDLVAKRDLFPVKDDRPVFAFVRLEISLFVKFRVVGQVAFGNERKHFSAVDDGGAVVQYAVRLVRDADKNKDIAVLCALRDRFQSRDAPVEEYVLPEQIAAGVAADAKFGKDDKFRALLHRKRDLLHDLLRIELRVRHADVRRCRRNFYESVFHSSSSVSGSSSASAFSSSLAGL